MNNSRFAVAALLVGAALSLGACGHRMREEPDAFTWDDELAPGATIHVSTTNGGVTVQGVAEHRVHVQGSKRWRHGRERDVQFVASRKGDDVYLCAIWTRRGGRCGEQRFGPRPPRILAIFSLFRRRSDMSASFEVNLPPGVAVNASTVNGRVVVNDAAGDVQAKTVNGDIKASTNAGALELTTVNGSIRAVSRANDAPVRLETVNGSVRAELPNPLNAEVRMTTVNGQITTDFPLSISGKASPRDLRGTIGNGRRPIELKTVNGSVALKAASGSE